MTLLIYMRSSFIYVIIQSLYFIVSDIPEIVHVADNSIASEVCTNLNIIFS